MKQPWQAPTCHWTAPDHPLFGPKCHAFCRSSRAFALGPNENNQQDWMDLDGFGPCQPQRKHNAAAIRHLEDCRSLSSPLTASHAT